VEAGTENVPVVKDETVGAAAVVSGRSFFTSRSGSFMRAVMRV